MPPRAQPTVGNANNQPDLTQLQNSINALTTTFQEFRTSQDSRHASYLNTFQEIQAQLPEFQNPFASTSTGNSSHATPHFRPPKLILQPFDGSNSLEWIFQAEQFFTHYVIPSEHRLQYLSAYMSSTALAWFQWLHSSELLSTWDAFTLALETRFSPSTLENPQQNLFKLQQTSTVSDYQSNFEKLCNRVVGLSPRAILDYFISGLNTEIKNELAILRPTTVSQWLQTLGPFLSDFSMPSMQFHYNNTLITIQGQTHAPITAASFHQLTRMINTNAIALYHSITMLPTPPQDPLAHPDSQLVTDSPSNQPETLPLDTLHPNLIPILQHWSYVFSTPTSLPPSRPHDHHIHLLPDTSPINLKPYRYPHF